LRQTHGRPGRDFVPSLNPSFPRKRESGASGSSLALDARFRGHDGKERGAVVPSLCTFLILLIALLLPTVAKADPPIPPLTGRVVDLAHLLDQSASERITAELAGLERQKGIQLVVVTLPDLQGYTIEDWGLALGRGWQLGQKGKDNGVVLLVAPKDRALRIEVGYGLEGDLPDATADDIIRRVIIPYFRSGQMAEGIEAGVQAIIKDLGGKVEGAAVAPPESQSSEGGLPFAAVFFIFLLFIFIMNLRRRRGVWGGYYPYGGFGGGIGRGGGSSGGFSGGGFSGGGGSFGGGGASGRW
jgi:uncharacterized protein